MQKKISFHPALILLTLVLLASGCFSRQDKEPQQMNILFLISDDLRAETGSYGGKASPRITQSIDLYPTLVDLCNLPVPEGIEGLSLKPLLENPHIPWEQPAYTVWSENGSTASGQAVDGATMTGVSVRTERWHYAEFFGRGPGAMLLDPLNDPAYADVCSELSKLVHDFAGGLTAPNEVENSK